MGKKFKITYATLASPDPDMDRRYDESVAALRAAEPGTYANTINNQPRTNGTKFSSVSPVNLDMTLGHFYEADANDVNDAVAAAKAAFPKWRATPWQERVDLLNKVADLISDRVFDISAALSFEVGKNRLESLGDVEESADLIRYCTEAMAANNGFDNTLAKENENSFNRSILKPYGVWAVISPFNFPAALSAGPCGGALVTGNTVVHKPAEDAPFTSWLIGQCFVDAGLPDGVFNQLCGAEATGKAIVAHDDVDGITFTGSYAVGMSIARQFATGGKFARPVVLEMGGKNPTIVSNKADLEKAAAGVMRSAFGLTGQKCSACSRVYVHTDVKSEFTNKLVEMAKGINVGDPTDKANYIGPLINERAYNNFKEWVAEMDESADVIFGGKTVEGNGYFVQPTIIDNLPADSPYWKKELFMPVVKLAEFSDFNEAMARANDSEFGLTAGFFSEDESEIDWFLDNIEAGVIYVNRPNGATTGAWPGYQAFGGWKGSTGTGKAAGSLYYLQQYMHEQSHTIIS